MIQYTGRILLMSVLIGGCASPFEPTPDEAWFHGDVGSWESAGGGARHWAHTLATEVTAGSDVAVSPDAGPEAYVRAALARHPGIQAAQRKVERLTERIEQAQSLDDPMFMVDPVGEMAETAAGQVGLMTRLSQRLPFPGKLRTRGKVAAQDVAVAVQELESVRLAVAADTRRAFWTYYFSSRGLEVIAADRQLLSQFRQIAEAKYRSGTATQQDVLRASVELSNLENELITLRQRQTTAVAMLNSLLDRPVDAALAEPKAVELSEIALQLDRLLAHAARANPELGRIRERIEGSRQRLKLARLQRWPDPTVSVNYNAVDDAGLAPMANGDDQWWMGFGINLPVWLGKLEAAENEARTGILEGVADLTNRRNRVAFRVQDAMVKVETQQRLALLFRDVIVPQARQTMAVSEGGYRAGRENFLTLVDNWRKMLDFELMYHQSLSQLEQSFAELQQVVGHDLGRRDADEAELESQDSAVPPPGGASEQRP